MNFSTSQFADQPTSIEQLGYGPIVTHATLEKMKSIILASIRNYYVRLWAEQIIGFEASDYDKAQSVFNFVVNHSRYVHDPVGLELLKTPIISLQLLEIGAWPALDCDDAAILIGSLLMSIGIPYALRAVSFDDEYTHVYGLFYTKERGWTPIDFVVGKKGGQMGDEPPGITKIKDVEVT